MHDGLHVATDLRELDDDDRLTHYYAYFWFEICRTTLDLLGETLSLDNIILKDETTGGSRAICYSPAQHAVYCPL